MKKLLFLIPILLIGYIIFTGQKSGDKPEKWSIDPRMTMIYATGEYVQLPQVDNYVHPNTAPMVYETPIGVLTVSPNFRVYPSNVTQSEVPITRHPTNQSIMFASSNAVLIPYVGFISEGVYVTTNSGVTWFGSDTTKTTPVSGHGGDPAPAIAPNGYFHQSFLGGGMNAAYSTNNGISWSTIYKITTGSQDKNHTFINDVSSSPYYGRIYVTWSRFNVSNPPAVVSYSTNNGVSYSSMINVNTSASGHYSQGVNGAIAPNGDAYICWGNPISGSPYTGDFIGFAKSTNGGVTWVGNNNVYDCNDIRGTLSQKSGIRVNGFPWMSIDRTSGPRAGWIYIVTGEKNLAPAGSDPDIIMHRSSNGGTTWSAGIRVNQDPLNNGKIQYMPCIRVDEDGGLNVVYYDDRNTSSDSAEVYVSRSIDGGNTWTDILVSDHRFKPKPIPGLAGGYQGDYIGITSGNYKVWPYWCSDKSGIYQAWITSIDLGPSVSHTPLPDTENLTGPYPVNCVITPAGSPIVASETKLYWTRTTTFSNSVLMTNTSGNNWTANIPGNGSPATYRYYIYTKDVLNRVATSPPGAPAAYHSFIASADTVDPNISHTPLPDQPKNTWPATVNAVVTDNFGVDSVWVKWYINTPSVVRHFKLNNTSGNNYSANFNSDTSQIQFNDVIYYKIFAMDNSSGHNVDSTSLYNFTIIAQTTACVGTGSSSCAYPFYTYYEDSRTDMLYTASEIIANGGESGQIKKIGFDVISAAPQTMNGFEIKMQHTTATSLSGFTSTGWTTVYSGNYSVPGTGMQYVTLTTPFAWNGTSNVLIEICFHNTSWTSNSTVKGTSASGKTVHQHLDNNNGCSLPTGASQTYRPNICFVIDLLTGNQNISSSIPNKYSLSQNYPNPFNPTTKISFDLPKQGFVTLKVYDVLGKEVAKLVNEQRNAGSYIIDFNASHLSSGVYYFRIESGEFMQVKKMVLIK